MWISWLPVLSFAASFFSAFSQSGPTGPASANRRLVLWRIGQADGETREFALGPDGYRDFARDAFYVVGTSNPAQDWPYVQPGPRDYWQGNCAHTFTVAFGLHKSASERSYQLVVDLADTHPQFPPELEITCNDRLVARHATLPGKSEHAIEGQFDRTGAQQIEVGIAAELLHDGLNQIDIRTVSGSWLLYDSVRLDGPPD